MEKFLGLDQPIYIQYLKFLKRLVTEGSLGQSFVTRQSVNEQILDAAPVTASVVFGAMILVLSIAIPLGIFSALRPRSLLDRVSMIYVLIGISLPSFWIGLVLSYFVGYKLGLTPLVGLLRGRQRPRGLRLRWLRRLGLPPDPPLYDARDRRRGDVRPLRPGRGDGDADHGLRAHRARQGRARSARSSARTSCGTRCSPS